MHNSASSVAGGEGELPMVAKKTVGRRNRKGGPLGFFKNFAGQPDFAYLSVKAGYTTGLSRRPPRAGSIYLSDNDSNK